MKFKVMDHCVRDESHEDSSLNNMSVLERLSTKKENLNAEKNLTSLLAHVIASAIINNQILVIIKYW